MAALLMNVSHTDAAEQPPPTTVLDELTLIVVEDQELDAIYGKGYRMQLFHPEAAMPVILWDEGKRKGEFRKSGQI